MIFTHSLVFPTRSFYATTLLLALIAGVGLAFIWPWRTPPLPGGPLLARYAPLADGASALVVIAAEDGRPLAWESRNLVFLRSGRVIATDLRETHREAIRRFYQPPDQAGLSDDALLAALGQAQVYEQRFRRLQANGSLGYLVSLNLRQAGGDYTVAVYDPAAADELVFEPPLLNLPAGPTPGQTWQSAGQVSGNADYLFEGRIVTAGPFQDQADCLQLETRYTTTRQGQVIDDQAGSGWWCAGLGEVDNRVVNAITGEVTSYRLAATDSAAVLPPAGPSPPALAATDSPDGWRLQRVGRARSSWDTVESTIPATYIPANPPVVLAAAYGGDLVAFDAGRPTGQALWRFHPGGAIYSQPAFDAASGRLYFGATDKRLYALDGRGLFLWAYTAGDNIATRPLVVGETVFFGSEDRAIYALDAASGVLRWQITTNGAVVASPASAGGVVMFGSDDGTVYGLDPASGEARWTYSTGDAVEAPLVVEGETVYVAGRDGNLYALAAASGEELWVAGVGQPLRAAPAVGSQAVFVVDDTGYLSAFERQTGQRLWISAEYDYVGPPALVGDGLLVAGLNGQVYRVGLDGRRQSEPWLITAREQEVSLRFGPELGGGAAWLADSLGVIWRVGPPPAAGPAPLNLAWVASAGNAPFAGFYFYTTPVEQAGQAVVVDDALYLYRLDPVTGQAVQTGQLGQAGALRVEPVVAEDRSLLAPVRDRLVAMDLVEGRVLWEFTAAGISIRPVTVAGRTVLWQIQAEAETESGRLYALDLDSGRLLWQVNLNGFANIGGVVAAGQTVFSSTPPAAYDLATGRQVWQAQVGGLGLGGPALKETGDTLFVGVMDPASEQGEVVALDTASGEIRWQVELPANTILHPLDRLWPAGDVLVAPLLGQAGLVLGLDMATGAERWRYLPAPVPRFGNLTVTTGRVWLALEEGQVLVLDAGTGREVASYNDVLQNLNEYSFAQRPALVGGRLIAPQSLVLLGFELPED